MGDPLGDDLLYIALLEIVDLTEFQIFVSTVECFCECTC